MKRWLRACFEKLPLTDQSGLDALAALGVPLATTNYDDLLERATELPPVTWHDQGEVFRVLRGEERAILHLHGFWKKPESIVLGIRSYDRVRQDPHARAVIESLAMTGRLLFLGCGEGLGDPNFRRFFDWLRSVNLANEALHYRLVPDGEVASVQKLHPPEERLRVLGYGKEHGDLAGFLAGLVPPAKPSSPVGATGGSGSGPGMGGPAPRTPALLAYRRRVGEATSRLELIGLGRGVAVDLPIESAYLPLRTAASRSGGDLGSIRGAGRREGRGGEGGFQPSLRVCGGFNRRFQVEPKNGRWRAALRRSPFRMNQFPGFAPVTRG